MKVKCNQVNKCEETEGCNASELHNVDFKSNKSENKDKCESCEVMDQACVPVSQELPAIKNTIEPIDVLGTVQKALNQRNERIAELENAMLEFVIRCEKGKVQSIYTYDLFNKLLNR